MKKFISIMALILIMTFMFSAFAIGAYAQESDIKLKVSAYELYGDKVEISSHTDMEEGWYEAMKLAGDSELMNEKGYIYVVVDLLDDWIAKDGKFSDNAEYSSAYYQGALYIPSRALVMLNLNGHTIDRDLDDYKYNGEVICVGERANFILNGGSHQYDSTIGTITGGFSCNGAGGIHIHDNARVTLNYVSVSGNRTEDDNGAGIALYNGAQLMVEGGEISNNHTYGSTGAFISGIFGFTKYINYGAGVYVKDANAIFSNVIFTGNKGFYGDEDEAVDGDVIAARGSNVTMSGCKVFNNSIRNEKNELYSNVFYIEKSKFNVNNCDIYDNGSKLCYLFRVDNSTLEIKSSKIHGNGTDYVICAGESEINMYKSEIYDNDGGALLVLDDDTTGEIYTSTFNNNSKKLTTKDTFTFTYKLDDFYFSTCDFGNSTFKNKNYAQFETARAASIISEGSVTMFTSIAALAVAITALVIVIVNNKRNSKKPQ